MRQIAILGSTGSIGTQALDVVRRNPERFKVIALTAGSSHELLVGQVREFMPQLVAVAEEDAARELTSKLGRLRAVEVLSGPQAAEFVAREVDADMVLNAMVGAVGLRPTLAALQSGKMLALANKESLIVGGELVMDLVKGEPERLVPVDSEHAALAQCLRGERRDDLSRVIITGSGGPFRGWTREELALASVKEALAHPTWSMGPKITIDSATLMNKGLEVIEARWLFGVAADGIDVLVHPQSIVHSMVELVDGSVIAQLGVTDMRLPIQYAFSYPERWGGSLPSLDLARAGRLEFEHADTDRFPCLDLAFRALRGSEGLSIVLNAANEVAVSAFLDERLSFTGIPGIIRLAMDAFDRNGVARVSGLDDVRDIDRWARDFAVRATAGVQSTS